jgi:hypothetical protein
MDKLMENPFIYRLMPKWRRFIYIFNIMANNRLGCLHVTDDCYIDFETFTIERLDERY